MPAQNLITRASQAKLKSVTDKVIGERIRRNERGVKKLEQQIALLLERRKSLFQIEREAYEVCTQEIEGLRGQLQKRKNKRYIYKCTREAERLRERTGFAPLDWQEFLTWKNPDGSPALVLFSLEIPEVCLQLLSSNGHYCRSSICNSASNFRNFDEPRHREFYQLHDALYSREFSEKMRRDGIRYYRTKFTGVIPDDVRQVIIDETRAGRWAEIFILAEVTKWETGKVDRDPLVLGRHGTFLFHIAQFDLSPTETAAMWEVDPRL